MLLALACGLLQTTLRAPPTRNQTSVASNLHQPRRLPDHGRRPASRETTRRRRACSTSPGRHTVKSRCRTGRAGCVSSTSSRVVRTASCSIQSESSCGRAEVARPYPVNVSARLRSTTATSYVRSRCLICGSSALKLHLTVSPVGQISRGAATPTIEVDTTGWANKSHGDPGR